MTAVGSNVFLDVDGAALAPHRGSDVKSRVGRVRRLPSGDRRDDGSVGRGTGLRRCLGLGLSTGHHPDRAHASWQRTDAGGGPAGAPHGDGTRMERSAAFQRDTARSARELSGTRHPPPPRRMTPVSWPFVPAEMASWVDHVNALDPSRAVFPEALAALYCRFERIHPFLDGNGRTGRLILNLILVRHGYPPVIIYKRDRARYLRALQRADTGDASGYRRDARSGDSRQPSPLRHPGRRRCGQARATGSAGDPRHEGVGPASGGRPGTAPRHTRIGRPVAQLPHMGRGVPGEPLSPRRNDTGD